MEGPRCRRCPVRGAVRLGDALCLGSGQVRTADEGEREHIKVFGVFGKNVVVVALFVGLTIMSVFSFSSVQVVRGNARTVNYAGLVRGLGQRLVKWELAGRRNDALASEIDRIIEDLEVGQSEDGPLGFADPAYQRSLEGVRVQWKELEAAIEEARRTGETRALFDLSEGFFETADTLTGIAERLSEQNTGLILSRRTILLAVVGALLVCFLFQAVELMRLLYRNRFLRDMATRDPTTSLPNRWSCDLQIEKYRGISPLPDLMCFIADLNNLKKVNDTLGHATGDRLIVAFARILVDAATPYGFVGRNGGDEFLGFFEKSDPERLRRFHEGLRERVDRYNETNDEFSIRFAFGGVLSSELEDASVYTLINVAEQRMYKDKVAAKRAESLDP